MRDVLTGLALIILLLAGAVIFVVATEPGARWAINHAAGYAPGELAVGEVRGRLIGPLTLKGARYDWDDGEAAIARLHLEWHPAALWGGTLDVARLEASGVDVAFHEAEPPPPREPVTPFTLPELPVAARIASLRVTDVAVRRPGSDTPFRVDMLEGDDLALDRVARIGRVAIHGPDFQARLAGEAELVEAYAMALDLEWSATPAGGPALAGRARLAGDRHQLILEHDLEAPFAARLEATVSDLFEARHWTAKLDVPEVDTATVDPTWPPGRGRLEASVEGTGDRWTAGGRGRVELAGYPGLDMDLKATYDDGALRVDGLELSGLVDARLDGRWTNPLEGGAWEAALDLASLSLRRLDPGLPAGDWAAELTARGAGDVVEALDGRFRAKETDAGDVAGAIRGAYRDGEVRIDDLTLYAPVAARAEGVVRGLPDAPRWDAQVTLEETALAALDPDWPEDIALGGRWRGEGGLDAFQVEGATEVSGPAFGRVVVDVRAAVDGHHAELEALTLRRPDGPGRLVAQGTADWGDDEPVWQATGHWEGWRWPLDDASAPGTPEGGFSVRGRGGDYTFNLDGAIQLPGLLAARLALNGRGDADGVVVDALSLAALDGEIRGNGRLAWAPGVEWSARLEGRDLDPETLVADLPGRLSAVVNTEGRMTADGLTVRGELTEVSGELHGHAVSGGGQFATAAGRHRVERLEIVWGPGHLSADGTLGAEWDLRWALEVAELAALHPDAAGALAAEGRVRGEATRPQVSAGLEGAGLQWAESRLEGLEASVDVDLADRVPSVVTATVTGVVHEAHRVDRLQLDAQGHLDDHRIDVAATVDDLQLDARLAGAAAVTDPAWRGTLDVLTFDGVPGGPWSLTESAGLRVAAGEAVLDEACWGSGDSRLCTAGRWHVDDGWQGGVELAALPLALAHPWVPDALRLDGHLSGEAAFEGAPERAPRGQARLALSEGAATYEGALDDEAVLAFSGGEADVRLEADGARMSLEILFADGGSIGGHMVMSPGPAGYVPEATGLDGRLAVEIPHLGVVLGTLVPELEQPRGRLEGQVAIAGTMAQPVVDGHLRLADGAFNVPALGIAVREVGLEIASEGEPLLDIRGAAVSGEGSLEISGYLDIGSPGWPLELAIEGRRVQVADHPEARIYASPDLVVRREARRVDISGDIVIPEARLQPVDLGGAVTVSPDVVIVDADEVDEPTIDERWAIHSRVRVVLGDRVRIRGHGLTGRVEGSLLAVDEPGQVTTGQGELHIVDGRYRAYGQDLNIERGRLLFPGGPVDNPGLDIRAARYVGDVTAGIQVRGTVREPEIGLYSVPPMEEADVLSYVVLGRPVHTASAGEGQTLAAAAAGLSLAGGERLAREIDERFGLRLDEVRLESGREPDEVHLVLGRYLSPRLYVSYGIGMFEAVNTVRMRYSMGRRWALETEAGRERAADLIYSIER